METSTPDQFRSIDRLSRINESEVKNNQGWSLQLSTSEEEWQFFKAKLKFIKSDWNVYTANLVQIR